MSDIVRPKIWYDEPSVLYAPDGAAFRILPTPEMGIEEKLNAVMRLSTWFAVIAALIWRDARVLILVPVVAAVEAFAYQDLRSRAGGVEAFLDARGVDVRDGKLCSKPTRDNPFMNVLLTDAPTRPGACRVDAGVAARQSELFTGTARDIELASDPFDVHARAAARQFYTNPITTVPNDQDGYLKFVYGDMMRPGCRNGDGDQCFRNIPGLDARPGVL